MSKTISPSFSKKQSRKTAVWVSLWLSGAVRNGTGGAKNIGFIAVGYNANNEAVEVRYSGSSYTISKDTMGSSVTNNWG